MRRQIDLNHDGRVTKTEVLSWWKSNCSPDVREFDKAWLKADQDCDDELNAKELKALLGFEASQAADGQLDGSSEDVATDQPQSPVLTNSSAGLINWLIFVIGWMMRSANCHGMAGVPWIGPGASSRSAGHLRWWRLLCSTTTHSDDHCCGGGGVGGM